MHVASLLYSTENSSLQRKRFDMMKVESMTANRLYVIAVDALQRELGMNAWQIMSPRQRRGMIAHDLLTIVASESTGDALKRDSATWHKLICDLELLVNDNDPIERV